MSRSLLRKRRIGTTTEENEKQNGRSLTVSDATTNLLSSLIEKRRRVLDEVKQQVDRVDDQRSASHMVYVCKWKPKHALTWQALCAELLALHTHCVDVTDDTLQLQSPVRLRYWKSG